MKLGGNDEGETHRSWSWVAIRALIVALATLLVLPGSALALEATKSNNAWRHDYSTWSHVSTSALTEGLDGSLQRVEMIDSALYVETFDTNFNITSSKVIDSSTYNPSDLVSSQNFRWGGFFSGSDANYVVTGQTNESQSDTLKVIRITKYSKNWDVQLSCELSSINTFVPFDAGSCVMVESGGNLFLRTCHTMYRTSDGLHHQASMTFVINERTMQPVDYLTGIMNIEQSSLGYVSHSFNQALTTLGGSVYSVDHGDAYPRAIVAKRLGATGSSSYGPLVSIAGTTGDNTTYTTLGGTTSSASANTILTVGTQRDQQAAYASSDARQCPRNVWLTVTNANNLSSTRRIALTTYSQGSTIDANNPFIVKVSDDQFVVLWGVTTQNTYGYAEPHAVVYLFVDGQGNITRGVQTFEGRLSDCQPIVKNGSVVWFATGGSSQQVEPFFYEIDCASGRRIVHFTDVVSNAWYQSAVNWCNREGLITGYSGTELFGVGNPLTRGQLATILWRNACPAEAAAYTQDVQTSTVNQTGLAGVADGQYYTAAANWAVANHVINGVGGTDFAADSPVTCEQLLVILGNMQQSDVVDAVSQSALNDLSDQESISAWALQSAAWAKSVGLITGYPNGNGTYRLSPQESINRERVATILKNAFEQGILERGEAV